jgi:Magnesium chelatase, subunit ChlI
VDIEPQTVDLEQFFRQFSHAEEDFVDVKAQNYDKRAILIAGSGSQNILVIGPPGTDKTLLATRPPTILPPSPRRRAWRRPESTGKKGIAAPTASPWRTSRASLIRLRRVGSDHRATPEIGGSTASARQNQPGGTETGLQLFVIRAIGRKQAR